MFNCNNIAEQAVTTSDGTISVFYPPKVSDNKTKEDMIRDAVFRSTHLTSKHISICEFSGEIYSEDNDVLVERRLKGSRHIDDHHCFGNILYNKDLENDFKQANFLFEIEWNCIQKHSFQGKKIKIQRTNGDIHEATICEDSPITFTEKYNTFLVKVEFDGGGIILYKSVPFETYQGSVGERKGILELNPHLVSEELVVYFNEDIQAEWMKEERIQWSEKMRSKLNNTPLRISYN